MLDERSCQKSSKLFKSFSEFLQYLRFLGVYHQIYILHRKYLDYWFFISCLSTELIIFSFTNHSNSTTNRSKYVACPSNINIRVLAIPQMLAYPILQSNQDFNIWVCAWLLITCYKLLSLAILITNNQSNYVFIFIHLFKFNPGSLYSDSNLPYFKLMKSVYYLFFPNIYILQVDKSQ